MSMEGEFGKHFQVLVLMDDSRRSHCTINGICHDRGHRL